MLLLPLSPFIAFQHLLEGQHVSLALSSLLCAPPDPSAMCILIINSGVVWEQSFQHPPGVVVVVLSLRHHYNNMMRSDCVHLQYARAVYYINPPQF